jgi:succinate dehydrogenase flavin-adding protein (antitoxin of CptAB toxin-antitoxin module)
MADNEVARTPLFAFADTYVSERALLDPLFGTEIGVHEVDHLLPDFSTAQAERNAKHTQSALERLKELVPQDDLDRVAWAVMPPAGAQRRVPTHLGRHLLSADHGPTGV